MAGFCQNSRLSPDRFYYYAAFCLICKARPQKLLGNVSNLQIRIFFHEIYGKLPNFLL